MEHTIIHEVIQDANHHIFPEIDSCGAIKKLSCHDSRFSPVAI